MKFAKRSLGQNFLIDKNIINKIINLVTIFNKDIIEIGPGKGALTDEILNKKPKSLIIIEKDLNLVKDLKSKYRNNKNIKIFNADILKFDINRIKKNNLIIFGNLPYNISSQILVKTLKFCGQSSKFSDLIFMFQKELADKIIGKFPSKNYGRLSIISNYRLNVIKKFFVSPYCFFPRPKIISSVIHFKPNKKYSYKIEKMNSLEKVTNIFFSNKRKMINKNIKKILNEEQIRKMPSLNLQLRPSDISPETYYKITELFEKNQKIYD